MSYLRVFLMIILSLLISLGIIETIFNLHNKHHSPGAIFSQSIIANKVKCVKGIKKKKILFVGGSSVAYGIDAKLVEEKLDINSINFGCMVGLGPEILFENVRDFLKPGDTIVLCWEYETYRFHRRSKNLNYLALMMGPQKNVFDKIPFLDRLHLKLYFPVNLVKYSLYSLISSTNDLNEIYKCGWTFDHLGNVISNIGTVTSEAELKNSPLIPLISEHEMHQDLTIITKKILDFADENKVKIYATWPNTYLNSLYNSDKIVGTNLQTYKSFWKKLGVEVLGEPEDAMFPMEYFYDSVYHLNRKGAEIRTLKLIDELRLFK